MPAPTLTSEKSGNCFSETAPDEWAIDRETGNYLLWVPPYLPRALDKNFFFRFDGKTYALRVKGLIGPQLAIDDPILDGERGRVQAGIVEAFSVHKLNGRDFAPEFGQTWPARSLH